ncbi:terpene synthase family protein [Streptomyces sp. NPDC055709]
MRLREECAASVGQFSLARLFIDEYVDYPAYSRGFRPHPKAGAELERVQEWAGRSGIWLPHSTNYMTMNAFLHSTASLERLVTIGKLYALFFFLDDNADIAASLGLEELARLAVLRKRLTHLLNSGHLSAGHGVEERITAELFEELRRVEPPADWLHLFTAATRMYCQQTLVDWRTAASGSVLSVDEYIEARLHTSGMYSVVLLLEFGDARYLRRDRMEAIEPRLDRLRRLCAVLGALINDLFSFEKEFLRERSDYNLVPVILLNQPELPLAEGLACAAALIRGHLREFIALREEVGAQAVEHGPLAVHLHSLELAVQATWAWQLATTRYRREQSLFQEWARE